MKNLVYFLAFMLLISGFILQTPHKVFDDYVLNDKEVIHFGSRAKASALNSSTLSRGSYDGSRYKLIKNKGDSILLRHNKAAKFKHQSELMLIHNSGTARRNGDTLILEVEAYYKKHFLFKLGRDTVYELGQFVTVKIIAHDAYDSLAIPRLGTFSDFLQVYCLPVMAKKEVLDKAVHNRSELATFTFLSVKNKHGKELMLEAGDYVLVSGDHFFFENEHPEIKPFFLPK